MAYNFKTTKWRSGLMKKIKSGNTKPELALRRRLWGEGFRFSRRVSSLPGKPDIVLTKYKVVIFIDGEFWHGYNWDEKKKKIKANRRYWIPKIEKNILRDKVNANVLRRNGWIVVRFWQQNIEVDIEKCVKGVLKAVKRRKLSK